MALVRCEVEEGARPGYVSVGVPGVQGRKEYLSMEDRFLVRHEDGLYVFVIVIGRDPRHGTLLVQLPTEADSGANRMWIASDSVLPSPEEAFV